MSIWVAGTRRIAKAQGTVFPVERHGWRHQQKRNRLVSANSAVTWTSLLISVGGMMFVLRETLKKEGKS
jgi:hypothetical protein